MKSNGKRPARKLAGVPIGGKNSKRGEAKPKRTSVFVRAQPAPVLVDASEKNLAAQLARLETAQRVRRAADDETAYLFKHILTQEAAYGSLLHQQRREIHRCVAETYERFYTDRLDEFAALLAQHYAEAGDDAKTLDYSIRAGDLASRVYAHAEAIAQYTRALSHRAFRQRNRHAGAHLRASRSRV